MNTLNAETGDRAGDLQIFSLTLSQLSYRGNDSILVKNSHNTRDAEHLAWKPAVSTWQADAYVVAMRPDKQTNILTQVRSKRIMSPGQDRNACMASVGYICPDVRTISTKFRFTTAQRTKWHQVFAQIVHKHVYSLGCPFRSTHSNGGKKGTRQPRASSAPQFAVHISPSLMLSHHDRSMAGLQPSPCYFVLQVSSRNII